MNSFLAPDGAANTAGAEVEHPTVGSDANTVAGENPPMGSLRQSDLEAISTAVEAAVLPRLFGSMGKDRDAVNDRVPTISDEDVVVFADLCVDCEVERPLKFMWRMIDKGVPLESVYLDLISPAAKYLGDLWADDRCEFAHVTLGVSCMQRAMNVLGRKFESQNNWVTDRTALLLTMPGDQHSFGGFMAAEFMRRYGWYVNCYNPDSFDEIFGLIAENSFDFIGFSVSLDRDVSKLERVLPDLRAQSINPSSIIMAGGSAATQLKKLKSAFAVDEIGLSGRDTVLKANTLYLNKIAHKT